MSSKIKEPTRSLADSINIATRSVHTKLNKLVVYRLPLAMPPKAGDASQYVSGLLHIAPIYMTFESLWQDLLDSPALAEDRQQQPQQQSQNDDSSRSSNSSKSSEDKKEGGGDPAIVPSSSPPPSDVHSSPDALDPPHPPAVCPRIQSLLAHLYLPGLARSAALRRDLSELTGWSERTLSERLDDAAAAPALASFLAHARGAVAARPHVLLAYAWVLYMALFSGGRFIRASLEGVDPAFWVPANAPPSPPSPTSAFLRLSRVARAVASAVMMSPANANANATATARVPPPQPPHLDHCHRHRRHDEGSELSLGFFRFNTPSDGEDLKNTFKRRLAESEAALLTPGERDDVVREAARIFDFIVGVVGELDGVCGTGGGGGDGGGDGDGDAAAGDAEGARLLSLRSRDSVVVEKERERRKIARMAATAATAATAERARAGVGAPPAKGRERISENGGVGEGKGKGGVRFQ